MNIEKELEKFKLEHAPKSAFYNSETDPQWVKGFEACAAFMKAKLYKQFSDLVTLANDLDGYTKHTYRCSLQNANKVCTCGLKDKRKQLDGYKGPK